MFLLSSIGAFRILTVCTANICRSPVAERLLADALGAEVRVSSAGTHALVGEPIDHSMALRLRRRGIRDEGFSARQLRTLHTLRADLVVPLTTWHRANVLTRVSSARNKTFTLLELARIVDAPEFPDVPGDTVPKRLRAMVKLAARHRAIGQYISDDDVPDPYGQGPETAEASFQLMERAVQTISRIARG